MGRRRFALALVVVAALAEEHLGVSAQAPIFPGFASSRDELPGVLA